MFPNTTDPFPDLSCLITDDHLLFLEDPYHGLLWHHIFLPVFLLSSCSFQKESDKFQLFCCDLQNPPSLVSTHISNLTSFKFHSAHFHQETSPDFKSRIILYNYLTKEVIFFLSEVHWVFYLHVTSSSDMIKKYDFFNWENLGKNRHSYNIFSCCSKICILLLLILFL